MSRNIHNPLAPLRQIFFSGEASRLSFYIIISVVISALLIDTLLNYVADFIFEGLVTFWGVTLFFILASIYLLGQYVILQYLKSRTKDVRSKSPFLNATHKTVTVIQLFLSAILVYLILQIPSRGSIA